jgi:hypothetical protein
LNKINQRNTEDTNENLSVSNQTDKNLIDKTSEKKIVPKKDSSIDNVKSKSLIVPKSTATEKKETPKDGGKLSDISQNIESNKKDKASNSGYVVEKKEETSINENLTNSSNISEKLDKNESIDKKSSDNNIPINNESSKEEIIQNQNQSSEDNIPIKNENLNGVPATNKNNSTANDPHKLKDTDYLPDYIGGESDEKETDAKEYRFFDDVSSKVFYSGDWKQIQDENFFNTTAEISSTKESYFEITFTGWKISLVFIRSVSSGIVNLIIDGIPFDNYSLYSDDKVDNKIRFTVSDLSYGTHTIRAVVSGKKVNASEGTDVTFDAFFME